MFMHGGLSPKADQTSGASADEPIHLPPTDRSILEHYGIGDFAEVLPSSDEDSELEAYVLGTLPPAADGSLIQICCGVRGEATNRLCTANRSNLSGENLGPVNLSEALPVDALEALNHWLSEVVATRPRPS